MTEMSTYNQSSIMNVVLNSTLNANQQLISSLEVYEKFCAENVSTELSRHSLASTPISTDCLRLLSASYDNLIATSDGTTWSTNFLDDISATSLPTAIDLTTILSPNTSLAVADDDGSLEIVSPEENWPFLLLGLLVLVGGFGNILVCLAIGFERRLQNATNYFLLR